MLSKVTANDPAFVFVAEFENMQTSPCTKPNSEPKMSTCVQSADITQMHCWWHVAANKINDMSERTALNEIEKKIVKALDAVIFLPASYDKRFYRSLAVDALYTEKQKRYLHFVFNKYRRQIRNYEQLAFELQPERFDVKVKFETDLFSQDGKAEIEFKDTFKPSRFVSGKGQ